MSNAHNSAELSALRAELKDVKARLAKIRRVCEDGGRPIKVNPKPNCPICHGYGEIDDSFENGHNGDWIESSKPCECSPRWQKAEDAIMSIANLKNEKWKVR